MQNPLRQIQPHVFLVTSVLTAAFVVYSAVWTSSARRVFDAAQAFIVGTFGWFYVLAATFFLAFAVWLLFSRYGRITLGPPDARPEFSRTAWFAMLFSAGMGIGLVFWGVAEPMYHYAQPPMAEAESAAAMEDSMRFSFFHWGLHPWAIYVIVGLSLAYFHFRHDLPLAPRSVFYPLVGTRIYGPFGHAVDIIAVFATLFGLATSLGLGAMQVNVGLDQILSIGTGVGLQIALIAGITLVATVSVVLGVSRGIKHLSNFNMVLATGLLVFILVAGPTVFLLRTLLSSVGEYASTLVETSLWTGGADSSGWQGSWTLFYWGWWISWAPFVGLFIARISRGRTIREFIAGVLLVPTLYGFLWFTVFGGSALWLEHFHEAGIWAATQVDTPLALYAMLGRFPLSTITSLAATLLVVTFFVTSSDSGSLVVGMITTGGEPRPPRPQRVFWALAEGAIAAMLLLAGGLLALQTASIIMGLPMAVLLVLMCWSILRALRADEHRGTRRGIDYTTAKEHTGSTEEIPVVADGPAPP